MSWRRLWRDVGSLLSAGGLAVGRGDARAAEGDASPAHPRAMRRRGCASIVRPRRICWGRDGRAGGSAGLAGEQPTTNTTSPDSAQRATLPPSHCAIINPRRRARAPHTQTATAVCTESASRPAPRSLRPPRRPPRHRRLRRPCASRCPPRPRAPPSRREETTRHASPQSARGWPLAASTTPRPPSCAPRCVTRPSTRHAPRDEPPRAPRSTSRDDDARVRRAPARHSRDGSGARPDPRKVIHSILSRTLAHRSLARLPPRVNRLPRRPPRPVPRLPPRPSAASASSPASSPRAPSTSVTTSARSKTG